MWKERSRAEYSYNSPDLGGEGVEVTPGKSAFPKKTNFKKLPWAFCV